MIADCGRVGVDGPPHDLLAQAAAIVLLTRDDLGEVVRLRERVPALAAALDRRDRMSTTIGVVVIAGHKRFHAALAEVGEALGHGKGLLNVAGGLAYDPRAARQLRGEWGGRLDKSLLVRSARDVAGHLAGPLPALSMPSSRAARGPANQPGRGRHAGAARRSRSDDRWSGDGQGGGWWCRGGQAGPPVMAGTGMSCVDHGLVKRMRAEVGDRLAEQRRRDAASGVPPMSGEDERQFARALIAGVLEEHARTEITAGRAPAGAQEEEELASAVHAALFGVGRLQPLLDDPQIENIDINGCDRVFLSCADGREVWPTRSRTATRNSLS